MHRTHEPESPSKPSAPPELDGMLPDVTVGKIVHDIWRPSTDGDAPIQEGTTVEHIPS